MATLPDERSLGERPAIRTSGGVAQIGGATGYEGVAAKNELIASNEISNAGDILQKAQNEYDGTVVQDKINQLNSQRLTLEAEAKKVQGGNAANPEFYAKQRAQFDQLISASGEGLTPNQQRLYKIHAQQPALQFQSALLGHIATQSEVFAKNTYLAGINAQMTEIRNNPGDETIFNTAIENAKNLNLKETQRTGEEQTLDMRNQKFEQEAWTDRVDVMRLNDPVRALGLMQNNQEKFDPKQLDTLSKRMYLGAAPVLAQTLADRKMQAGDFTPLDAKAQTGIPEYDKMPPDWKLHVIGLANQQLARVTNLADKTSAALDAQLATGIPAPEDQKAQWQQIMRASGREQEYNDYLNAETQTQALLQSPLDQQIIFRNKLNDDLVKNGGTVKQQATVQRLTTAINNNIKLADENPIGFLVRRTSVPIEPIQSADLSDPAKLGAKIQARFDALDAANLPQKPLDPLEAGYFADALAKMPPGAAAGMFGNFRKAAGNDARFISLMQQVGNGTQAEAYAGILWAKNQSAQSGTSWFGANPTINAAQIATTMTTGARLLNQSGVDKADKGKLGFFLPNDAAMQTAFANYVGDAFAGLGKEAMTSYNMMKTYYAGRASEKGIIAADKTIGSIDSDLLDESIRVTLGNIGNIGSAKVIAPYGMSASDFQQQARDKFIEQMDAAGRNGASDWGSVTLQAVAPDQYKVVSNSGRETITNPKTGLPIVLDFRTDTMKDQFGRRPSELIPTDVPINAKAKK